MVPCFELGLWQLSFQRVMLNVMARPTHVAPPGWLSTTQARQYLGLTKKEFVNLAHRYGLASRKDGSALIYRISDIEAIAQSRVEK